MRKADRLFRIVEFLKARRSAVTAEQLAEELEVSVRTIYRDVKDLILSGAPITGEAGTGYVLSRDYILRPLVFDMEEIDALIMGAQFVRTLGDTRLKKAAQQALDKIILALPETLKDYAQNEYLFSFASGARKPINVDFASLRLAIRQRQVITFDYTKETQETTHRTLRPLALAMFDTVWLLVGWCEDKQDFRNFRLDRMDLLSITEQTFKHERGKTLADFQKAEAARTQTRKKQNIEPTN